MNVMWASQTGNVQGPSTNILSSSRAFHFYNEGTYMKLQFSTEPIPSIRQALRMTRLWY